MLLVGHAQLTTAGSSLSLSPSLWSISGSAFPLPQTHGHVVSKTRVLVCSQQSLHKGPQMRTSQITVSYGTDTLTMQGPEHHTAMSDLQLDPTREINLMNLTLTGKPGTVENTFKGSI